VGGVAQTLANGATLPAGHYGQMRLVLGSRNTVKLVGSETEEPLTVPSGQQSGVKLVVNFDVQAGTTYDVYIDFDAYRSVFVHAAGASGKYILRPTVRAFEKLETGSISGTLTIAGAVGPSGPTGPTGPIPGAVVTAQTLNLGVPTVVRSTVTDALGRYTLDLLPRDGTYYVVSQPTLFDTLGAVAASYEPQASGGITITAANPVQSWSGAFTSTTVTGALAGVVIPVATTNQSDIVDVRHAIGSQPFVVRTVTADVTSSGETYAVPGLPTQAEGRLYTVVGTRRTDNSGTYSYATTIPATTTVLPGSTSTVNLGF
jgi:hypothetical protein